jgi:hypothetical protein
MLLLLYCFPVCNARRLKTSGAVRNPTQVGPTPGATCSSQKQEPCLPPVLSTAPY